MDPCLIVHRYGILFDLLINTVRPRGYSDTGMYWEHEYGKVNRAAGSIQGAARLIQLGIKYLYI